MRPVSFVICAAGKGERFRQYGFRKSKPLLVLNGITMLERSIQSLDVQHQDQVIVISQKSDSLPGHFKHLKNVSWLEIEEFTKGQLDTFLFAKDLIKHDDVVIYNCDTYFRSDNLRSVIESSEYSGLIPCSREPGLSWSFCKVDERNNILAVAEKSRISDWASVGYYYFSDKKMLLEFALQEVKSQGQKEVYVAPLYNKYLEKNYPVKMVPVESFLPFGTIEQVKDYWGVSLEKLLSENS